MNKKIRTASVVTSIPERDVRISMERLFDTIIDALLDKPMYCAPTLGIDLISFGVFNALHSIQTPERRQVLISNMQASLEQLREQLRHFESDYTRAHELLSSQGAIPTVDLKVH